MDRKLSRWLEGQCRAWPGRRWLVHPAVLQWPPQLPFVLPDAAAKDAYVARAVRLGRLHLACGFVWPSVLFLFVASAGLSGTLDPQTGQEAMWAAAAVALAAVLVPLWLAHRADERLLVWLRRTGEHAPLGVGHPAEERDARWWSGGREGLKLCRPVWMAASEIAATVAAAACWVVSSVAGWGRCGCALVSSEGAEQSLAELGVRCADAATSLLLLPPLALMALSVVPWRGRRRSGKSNA